jgi:hypothetical protein
MSFLGNKGDYPELKAPSLDATNDCIDNAWCDRVIEHYRKRFEAGHMPERIFRGQVAIIESIRARLIPEYSDDRPS